MKNDQYTQVDREKSDFTQRNSVSTNLETEGRKQNSNQLKVPEISLPKGGGAIKSIDEKFSVNAINGTAGFSLPLPVSDARGFSPPLSISYNSGSGNGIFGLGWSLSMPSIRRKTEKELPKYFDDIDSDTYVISEAEDLVPEFKFIVNSAGLREFEKDANGNYILNEFPSSDGSFIIRRYRPRIEGLFARIERWTEKSTGLIQWRVISKDNVTTLYGKSPQSQIADPNNSKNHSKKVFEWLIEFSYDDRGRCMFYEYKKEDRAGINSQKLHNNNRLNGNALYTNKYLKRVRYGNIWPYKKHGDPIPAEWLFETVFDYGEHDEINLPFSEIKDWDFRTDAFSEYRSGFEIRTCRLCKRVLLYHFFAELPGGSALIRSMDFKYINNGEEGFTFLEEITVTGFTKHDDGSYTQKSLPPFSFTYQKHEWDKEVKSISTENLIDAPSGIDEQAYQFVDLYSEGLQGILTEQGNGWFYKSNWGSGNFTPAKLVLLKPSFNGLQSNLQLLELDSDGIKQITQWQPEPKGFFELNKEEEWQLFRAFEKIPNIDFRDPNLRMVDLDGDGKADVLITQDEVFTWYRSEGKNGYGASEKVSKNFDDEKGPVLVFANDSKSIFLADMSGDGLTDFVQIKNGEVCYWPNLGYGKFGPKVNMDHAPTFDHPDQFNPAFIELADIDGSGTTDIIYLGKNQFTIWLNQHGNGFLPQPKIIEAFPEITNYSKVSVVDLLGNGMACIVWSCDLPKHQNQPLRYIDLLKSKKPHILISYKNNIGKEVKLEYTPSTHFYIKDKLDGTPWVTKLHFPVHCVSKTIMYDHIMKTRFASEYSYHHGYYDHHEKEFRGFGRVDQTDAEDIDHFIKQSGSAGNNLVSKVLHQTPVQIKTWFHTGAFLDREKLLNQFSHEYFQNTVIRENLLPEPELETDLSIDEWRQALRACKGMLLRREVYAQDGLPQSDKPYAVEQHNAQIKKLQPKGIQKHAVFLVHESEAITYHYERNPADPRIAHNFILDIDPYGNVLQSANVAYPRKSPAAGNPANEPEQEELHIILSENEFTNEVQLSLDHRVPLLHFSKSYELSGLAKPADYYSLKDLKTACNNAVVIDYEVQPTSGLKQKRLIEFVRQQYRGDDGITVLPFGTIESKGMLHQSYKAAFNQNILTNIFGTKITFPVLKILLTDITKGAYIFADNYFWISSGMQNYDVNHFFLSTEFTNPFGNVTTVEYDNKYFLFVKMVTDALKNIVQVQLLNNNKIAFNYRTLAPFIMQDMNDNKTAVRFDELGMVVKSFIIGKKGIDAGDEFDDSKVEMRNATDFPSAEMNYGLLEWYNQTHSPGFDISNYKPKPNFVETKLRETHYHADAAHATKWQESYSYSDGGGHEVLKKVQAEPGEAKKVNPDGTVVKIDTSKLNPVKLRWVGNGRTILNNKGNPVKQYEPYFSVQPAFDDEKEMVELGVTPIIHYDPPGRTIRTDFPDGTFSKVEFDAWQQKTFDQNDTVAASKWYDERILNPIASIATPAQVSAAQKAFLHNDTPTLVYLDSLGRNFLTIADNGGTEKYTTKIELDIEGNQRKVIDARNNIVVEYQYDMLGARLHQKSMDAGEKWMLNNVMGKTLFVWDSEVVRSGIKFNQRFKTEYDDLQRPVKLWLTENISQSTSEKLIGFTVYGENQPNDKVFSLRGKPFQSFDQSGRVETSEYDFKGNPKSSSKKLALEYKQVIDWNVANPLSLLENETFANFSKFDALNRPIEMTMPDGSIVTPGYNEAGLLETLQAFLNRTSKTHDFITNIDYDAKGQRKRIVYGNNTATSYQYEPDTFRLKQLRTTRNSGSNFLQELKYTYDPIGNIVHIEDNALQTIFFNNARVEPHGDYEYDALYRLIKATGREHAGHNAPCDQFDRDKTHQANGNRLTLPGDMTAMQRYEQRYEYDEAGNMLNMIHKAGNGMFTNRWAREFRYNTTNNQLLITIVNNQATSYQYDGHGNMLNLQNGSFVLTWNHADQLQQVNLGGGGIAYYVYDASGQRARKVIENGTLIKERIYLGPYELYRERQSGTLNLERETLHIMDDKQRIALVEHRKAGTDNGLQNLIRYQYSNHLGSAILEMDEDMNNPQRISYEEYYPYGSTSYQATRNQTETPKRYRYTGKERDEESGLYYHGARYYAPWLGRWVSCDPSGMVGGINFYSFVSDNSITKIDPYGHEEKRFDKMTPEERLKSSPKPAIKMKQDEIKSEMLDPTRVPEWQKKKGDWQTSIAEKAVASGLVGGAIGLGLILSGPPGWVAGLTGALLFSGGVAAAGTGTIAMGLEETRLITHEQSEQIGSAGLLTQNISSPGGLIGGSIGAIKERDIEGLNKGADIGNLIEGGVHLGIGGYQLLSAETTFSALYSGEKYGWNTVRKYNQIALGIGNPVDRIVFDPNIGKQVRLELGHWFSQESTAGSKAIYNRPWNLRVQAPWEHARVDPFRNTGYYVRKTGPIESFVGRAPLWSLDMSAGIGVLNLRSFDE